eukprot:EC718832.1.p1 GENE.EC718832.1~~EC718832.1.p1  ORF type:complete len:68 (+),score=11.60 EC718832.1:49-252(+)
MSQPFLRRVYNFVLREPVIVASFALGFAGPALVLGVPTDKLKERRQEKKEEFIRQARENDKWTWRSV